MKNYSKKGISLLLALVLTITAFVSCPFMVSAATDAKDLESTIVSFWADPENNLTQEDIDQFNSGTKTTMTGAVAIHGRDTSGSKYLFLPSNADCNNLKIWFKGTTASVNGTTVKNGEPTDVFKDINAGGISKSYTIKIDSSSYSTTVVKSGDVGAMYIDTASGSLSKINSSSDHSVSEAGTVFVVQPDGTVDYDGAMEKMQGRGNGTWQTDKVKKPYNVKLASSTSLMGMNKAKKWVLLANYEDGTLLSNQITYDYADYIGIKYQPHCKPVDVYVNQQYIGSYQLAEKVEIKSNRLDVDDAYENLEIANGTTDSTTGAVIPADLDGTKVGKYKNSKDTSLDIDSTAAMTVGTRKYSSSLKEPTDYTGGYLYELEISKRWIEENAGFCGFNRQGWVIKSCDYASKNMTNYSYDLLYAMGAAVYNKGVVPSASITTNCSSLTLTLINGAKSITNPAPSSKYVGKKWSDILDADSAVKYYWTQEYFKNMDSSTSSTYFYKDSDNKDTKVYAGPVWDMDNSFKYNGGGTRWGYSWGSADGWYTKNTRIYRWRTNDSTTTYSKDSESPLSFYGALATNCTDFQRMANNYWYSVIKPATDVLSGKTKDPNGVLKSTAEYTQTIQKSGTMNNIRHSLNSSAAYNATSVSNGMNTWIANRNTWIDTQMGTTSIAKATVASVPSQSCTGAEIKPDVTITYGGVALQEGMDYTLSYSNNIKASTNAKITITGCGAYTGTKDVTFTINKGNLNKATATIPENAYAGDTITVDVQDTNGNKLDGFVNYQWYADDQVITGETSNSYTVKSSDMSKAIDVRVTGDGVNFDNANFINSNSCFVVNGQRPTGYTKTLAAWDYDYTANPDTLTTSDETGETYYYNSTSGDKSSSSFVTGTVDTTNNAKIKWSGTAELYNNDSNTVTSDQTPVMSTSKTDMLAWGKNPYFETVTSTKGYKDIQFSAKLGGSKKAPRDFKLQYSTDGINFVDVEDATYSITANKTMEQAFDNVQLPAVCNDCEKLYIRTTVTNDIAINGTNTIVGQTSGDSSINNIKVTGVSTGVITHLDAPTVKTTSKNLTTPNLLFNDDLIEIEDANGGADIYYSINGGDGIKYESPFNPFDETNTKNDKVTVKAWAQCNEIMSNYTTNEYTFLGTDVNQFSFDDYSQNVSNGSVFSTGGVYDLSGKMSAVTDGVSQYVPLYNSSNGAYSIAPDDGALWSENSGFYFEVSTAGYKDIDFTCQGYTTTQGPNSVDLEYSVDGNTWKSVKTKTQLMANSKLEQVYNNVPLDSECNNLEKLYIRVVTKENLTHGSVDVPQTTLFANASKGNMYINNIVISGDSDGNYKMPYTNKTTEYFSSTGTIKYVSPESLPVRYIVTNSDNKVVMSGTCDEKGIQLSQADGFNKKAVEPYKVTAWCGDTDDKSVINQRTYYYKGDTVVKFNYNDSTKPLINYINEDYTSAKNTSGTTTGTLSICPNGVSATTLGYSNSYGVKTSWSDANKFVATKKLDKAKDNGYWLVSTNTLDYQNLTLNLQQISSSKGPRDWGVAYSTDGYEFKYVANSNVRAISNDSADSPVETYNNFLLPAECNNQKTLYIKIFINGGESVDGTELEAVTKGNTGINEIELSGVAIPKTYDVTFNTYSLDGPEDINGTFPVDCTVEIDGKEYQTNNGTVAIPFTEGELKNATVYKNSKFKKDVQFTVSQGAIINVAVVSLDVNDDGIINAKDFAVISKLNDDQQKNHYKSIFQKFINVNSKTFIYTND